MPHRRRLALLAVLLALLTLAFPAFAEEAPQFQLHQISNGCADAYLILLDDIAIMIDGGNDTGRRPTELMNYLSEAGFERLTAYIVTHYHADHAGNLNRILELYGDEATVVYGPSETLAYEFQPLAAGYYEQMKDGDRFSIGPMDFLCLGPQKLTQDGNGNVDSLNFLITYGSRRFLFTGDYAHSAALLGTYADEVRDVDVLKFPHHGLDPFYITDKALLLVNPAIVITPGAYARVSRHVRDLGLSSLRYGNADGYFIIYSDGESLDVVIEVEPGQYAGQRIPQEP